MPLPRLLICYSFFFCNLRPLFNLITDSRFLCQLFLAVIFTTHSTCFGSPHFAQLEWFILSLLAYSGPSVSVFVHRLLDTLSLIYSLTSPIQRSPFIDFFACALPSLTLHDTPPLHLWLHPTFLHPVLFVSSAFRLLPMQIFSHASSRFWLFHLLHLSTSSQSDHQSSFCLPAFSSRSIHCLHFLFRFIAPCAARPFTFLISGPPWTIRHCFDIQPLEYAFDGLLINLCRLPIKIHWFHRPSSLIVIVTSIFLSLARFLTYQRRLTRIRLPIFRDYFFCRFRGAFIVAIARYRPPSDPHRRQRKRFCSFPRALYDTSFQTLLICNGVLTAVRYVTCTSCNTCCWKITFFCLFFNHGVSLT